MHPALQSFHPLVSEWFVARFGAPTEPQARGWPSIAAERDTLIAAPTGSGKTLAAFLACIDRLVWQGAEGTLKDETSVVYVSPLKALSNDIRKNLDEPLAELKALAAERGIDLPEIRTAVRTGDTGMAERAAMLKKPPHILITTPESLYLLVSSEKSRKMLAKARTVIVDEIHAVARDKRGAHLAISLERLDRLTGRRTPRVGLSATQRPIEEIARFLVGTRRIDAGGRPDCAILDAGHRRALDIAVEIPKQELAAVASKEAWQDIYDRIAELVREHRSTLIFVNTRRMS
ncbi:MAG TPA: DEAD/DEAH box helicase, partial [bacterium]|nr:DEAD/DEAH box helicase [bacterium]